MEVFQVISNEYNSDDGHYEFNPVDDVVFQSEASAIELRDRLNTESVEEYNRLGRKYGFTVFTGDPTDVGAIERFANRRTTLTFYTYETLRVL